MAETGQAIDPVHEQAAASREDCAKAFCRTLLLGHANKALAHANDPRTDYRTIIRQIRLTADLMELELNDSQKRGQ